VNRRNNNKKIAFAASLLLIFAIHFVNINFFYHSHRINGIIITHSHLHGKTHSAGGTHTNAELRIISEFSKLQTLAMAFVIFAMAFLILFGIINFRFISHKVLEEQFSTKSPRAPPVFI
jgi:hypothetical protein